MKTLYVVIRLSRTRERVNMAEKYNAVVLGSGGVGKSALTIRFVQSVFVDKYDPTIEDSYRKELTVDGRTVVLEILDTAGQEEYASLRPQYVRSGQGFLLVYAINDAKSFEELKTLYDEVLRIKDADAAHVPVIIVGNKCDLGSKRQVSSADVQEYAKLRGCLSIESSAKSNINISEAFVDLVRSMRQILPKPTTGKGKRKAHCTLI